MAFLILLAGLALLLIGGEVLVKGAVAIAIRYHIPTMVIGLTIVSFGTSAPELLVSLQAALDGHPDIAIGNVIGSNMANIALVLGLTALILPIPVARNTIRIDQVVMIMATLLLWACMWNGMLSGTEGLILFLGLIAYLLFLMRNARKERRAALADQIKTSETLSLWSSIALIVGGCIGLVFGSDLLVQGATEIARDFGVSEYVIGATVVAFGTSVPELATSIIAAFRKELDISVGNLVGSNIFNILCILGITSMVKPIPVNQQVLDNDIFWVLGITLAVFAFSIHTQKIQRWKGAILVFSYLVYVVLMIKG